MEPSSRIDSLDTGQRYLFVAGLMRSGPSLLYQLPAIAEAFPAARFVVLWRPLAEIFDSLRRAGETNRYLSPKRRARQLLQQHG